MHVLVVQSTANSTTFGWEQGLERLGHRVTVLTASPRLQFGGRPGAEIVTLTDSRWSAQLAQRSEVFHRALGSFPATRDAESTLTNLKPDAAVVKVDSARNIVIGRVLTRLGVPWVVWQEQLPPLSRRWRVARALGVRPSAAFTALDSRPGGVALRSTEANMPRISYVPYDGADRMRGRQAPRRSGSPLHILVVASFKNHVAKQQWLVLESAAEAGLLDGSVRFTFVGQGKASHTGYQRVVATAREFGVETLVSLIRNATFAEMSELYASHDVLVLPSVREQFGMAIVEGMAHGLPVVVSDAVGAVGCVAHQRNGLVFPVGKVAALGECLRMLAEDDGLRLRLGQSAREFVEEHLDPENSARSILGLLS
jgi:glycosyltransferase involved in cell wall biosynthesis